MADEQMIADALVELSDAAACASNDFHLMHLNFRGAEFDSMHKNVLKDYYEQAADDYDELAEKSGMFGATVPSANDAAKRIGWQSTEGLFQRDAAVDKTDTIIKMLLDMYVTAFNALNELKDARSIGVSNFLQTRVEYWSKERYYFNRNRKGTSPIEAAMEIGNEQPSELERT